MIEKLSRCGVYCGQCESFHGTISKLAEELKNQVEIDYSWAEELPDFKYSELIKGLSWLTKQQCLGCRQSESCWCEVKKCDKIKRNLIDNCLNCDEFLTCRLNDYQRKRYSYLLKDYDEIKTIGIEEYKKKQNRKEKEGVRFREIRDY